MLYVRFKSSWKPFTDILKRSKGEDSDDGMGILMPVSLVEFLPGLTLAQLLFTVRPHLDPEVWTIS